MFGLPFIFTGREGMWKVLEDEQLGRAFLTEGAEVGAGMVGLFYMDEGARNLFTTKEITGLSDIKSRKIRVPETQLMMDTMKALGASRLRFLTVNYTVLCSLELLMALRTDIRDMILINSMK